MHSILSKNYSIAYALGEIFFKVMLLFVWLIPLSVNAQDAQPPVTKSNVRFDKVAIKGVSLFKDEDIIHIIDQFRSKDIEDEAKFQVFVIKSINQYYLDKGYTFSMVSHCEIHENVLHIHVLEGSINEIVVQKEIDYIKNIQYVAEYFEKLKSIKPFNMKEANRYMLLLKRLLGKDLLITPVFLPHDKIDEKTPKTVDLLITNYKKVNGGFEVGNTYNNYISASNSDVQNTDIAQNSGFFSLGNIVTSINNPLMSPGNLKTHFSSSGDKKENILFSQYTHQVNSEGTQLRVGVGLDEFNFTKKHKTFLTAMTGISHPLILNDQHRLELSADLEAYTLNKKFREENELSNKTNVAKIVLGTNYELSLGTIQHAYTFQAHGGTSKQKFVADSEKNLNSTFTKFIFAGKIEYPLPNNFSTSVYLDAQYSNSKNLPLDEHFSAGQYPGGRGFLASEIYGKKGIQGTLELSHLDSIDHSFLMGINEYIYVDSAKTSSEPGNVFGTRISSLGIGIDAYLVDHLVLNLELNKPIQYNKSRLQESNDNKKVKLFATLRYNFSF